MRRHLVLLFLIGIATACAAFETGLPSQSIPTTAQAITEIVPSPALSSKQPSDDFFTKNNISLDAPECDLGLTPADQEGPYYKAGSPERYSLIDEGLTGQRLILVGYVLNQDCRAMPGSWLDFWQANASGEYDNAGYTLRGHQVTDLHGRYHLETILPGLYSSRPIEHIHVKIQIPGGEVFTTQLYFPTRPIINQTVTLEDHGDYSIGMFNFVMSK